jgi:multiple sugar transport system permease protein
VAIAKGKGAIARDWSINVVLVLLALVMLAPFWWVMVTSFLSYEDAFSLPPKWWTSSITFENYREVFKLVPFGRMVFNSLKISTIITVGAVTTSTLAAYAFARLRFPGSNIIFIIFLAALMVPGQVTVIPIFVMLRKMHLLNTHEAVYLPALINVFGIFLLRQFFLSIPRELEDSAKLDGAGHVRILVQIIMPLAAPAIAALSIFIFQASWNDFFWPNILLFSQDKMTLPVGLVALQGAYGGGPVVYLFAGLAMLVFPLLVLFVFTQRTLTESIAMTGIKG